MAAQIGEGDVQRLVTATTLGTLSGFTIGGVLGMRDAAQAHIVSNASTRYVSQLDAQRDLNTATVRGFVRHGSRWGWRLGGLAGIFGCASVADGWWLMADG